MTVMSASTSTDDTQESEIAEVVVAATIHTDGRVPAIVISTMPVDPVRSLAARSVGSNPLVGLVARIVAGITGVLLGVAISLVSAGFDTTRILLAVGAVALCVGWVVALLTDSTTNPRY